MTKIPFFFFFLSFAFSGSFAQDLYDFQHSAQFAEHLYSSKQFNLATTEYERLVFLSPASDSLQLRLLQSYQKAGSNKNGLQRAIQLYPSLNKMPPIIAPQYVGMLLKEHYFSEADTFITQYTWASSHEKIVMKASLEVFQGNWKMANTYTKQLNKQKYPLASSYAEVIDQGLIIHSKSPVLASMLSAVVPGSGKLYTGDWKDGILAFIMTAGSGWQAYRSFNRKEGQSVRGLIFASLTAGFYIGNIYGSHKAAKRYNRNQKQKLINKIETIFSSSF